MMAQRRIIATLVELQKTMQGTMRDDPVYSACASWLMGDLINELDEEHFRIYQQLDDSEAKSCWKLFS